MGRSRKAASGAIGALLALCAIAGTSLALDGKVALSRDAARHDVRLVNHARRTAGVRAVEVSSRVADIARSHVRRMARRNVLFHDANLGSELNHAGICWKSFAENVGFGNSVLGIHNRYMADPGHRAIVLDRRWKIIGDGVATANGLVYNVEDFVQTCR